MIVWTRAQRAAFHGLTTRMHEDVETKPGPNRSIVVAVVTRHPTLDGRQWFITPKGSTHRMDVAR